MAPRAEAAAPSAARSGEDALRGRGALVTGASRGIGRAVAQLLASAGANVVLAARGEAELTRVADAVGGHPVVADVATPEGVGLLARRCHALLGDAPDIVVSSAGGFLLAPIAETEVDALDRLLAANLRGPFLLMRAFLPRMLERGSGHLLSIGSVAGRVPMPGNGAYSASKYGLRGLHEVLAEEVRGTGVRATLVEPAATDTPLWDALDPDSRADLPSRADMLRPDEVARTVVFALAQPAGVEIPLLSVRAAR